MQVHVIMHIGEIGCIMRRRLISIYILCVLVCCTYGCAKTDEENLAAETGTVGTGHLETEDTDRADLPIL